jgi:glycosyltransferase involved in cell wall biosynthesis
MNGRRIDLVFPRFKILSGAERAILGIATALAREGQRPRIVCHQFDPSCRPRLTAGVELECTGAKLDWSRNRYVNAIFDYVRTLRLRPALDPRADLRVFFGPALLLAWRLKWFGRRGRPTIYYCWEPPRALYQDRAAVLSRVGLLRLPLAIALSVYRRLDRRMVTAMDAVVTSSPFAARQIEKRYGRPATVITLGVDRSRLDQFKRDRPAGAPILLTVNYLHPRKRVDLIIEALAMIRRREESLAFELPRLRVIGEGPEKEALMVKARTLGVDDLVEFLGFLPDDDLPRYYWGATCYVHAAVEESFGLSVIEAAYCECPIVAVDEGGVRDTVEEGVNGFRVPASAAELAGAIVGVLSLPDRGASLGIAGRQRVDVKYQWRQGVEDLLRLAAKLER